MMLDYEENISIDFKQIILYIIITYAPVETLENTTKTSWK